MGKSRTPKYVLKYSYICFVGRCKKVGSVIWDCKKDGRPTESNLKKWRQLFNQSLENGGANSHLKGQMSAAGKVWVITNRDKFKVCEFNPPMFEEL